MGSKADPGLFIDTTEGICQDYVEPVKQTKRKVYNTFLIGRSPTGKENISLFHFASVSKSLHVIQPALYAFFTFVKKVINKERLVIRNITSDKYPIWKTLCLLLNEISWRAYLVIMYESLRDPEGDYGQDKLSKFFICGVHIRKDINFKLDDQTILDKYASHSKQDKNHIINENYAYIREVFIYVCCDVMKNERQWDVLWKTINMFGVMLGAKAFAANGSNNLKKYGFIYGDIIGMFAFISNIFCDSAQILRFCGAKSQTVYRIAKYIEFIMLFNNI